MVHACTRIHRAPSDAFRALSPYHVVLVDLDEGFRAMGHGEAALVIGDRVCCTVRMLGHRVLPYFSKAGG